MQAISHKDHNNIQWLKNALKTFWLAPQYCGLCLETQGTFYPLQMEFAMNENQSTKPLRNVVGEALNVDIDNYVTSSVICEQCTEKTIKSYVFIQNTKTLFNILNNCTNDIQSKVTDLRNEIETNNNFEADNVMIIVEYDQETKANIELLTSGNNTILTDKPKQVMKPQEEVAVAKKTIPKLKDTGPIIKPIPRVVKYPRTKGTEKPIKKVDDSTPNVILEAGKIVIAPLKTNNSSPSIINPYKCSSCPDIFTTYRSLKEHEKRKHNFTIFECRFCPKTYSTQQYLDMHYKTDHSKTRCRRCQELFDNNEFNSHLKEKHSTWVHACKYCELVYYTVEQLETHHKSTHQLEPFQKVSNKSQCPMCLRYLPNSAFKLHKCKFSCLDCPVTPCVHYSYLMSYREQVLSHALKVKCLDCDYVTARKEHLISHVNREHLDHHPFVCDDCGTQFYTKLSLKSHIMQFHHDLKCQYCDTEFKFAIKLNNHREFCKKMNRQHRCDECVASFDTESDLETHKSNSHSEIVYPCALCKKEFVTKLALEEHHAKVHTGIQNKKRRKFIECTVCDITFRSKNEMLEHEKMHVNETFPCKACPKTFDSLLKVYQHKQKHYSERTRCPGCEKLVSYINEHVASCPYMRGENRLPYVCEICGKAFRLESALTKHQLSHTKNIDKPIGPTSMKKYRSHSEQKELKTSHMIVCTDCGYVAKAQTDYENHINKMHLKIKPYVCNVCSRAFCGKVRLTEHMKTHNTNSSCHCACCGKKFANKVCLKMHMRRHTGEKPYECNICHEKFRSMSIMKTHRLKKHQDRTVQCPICHVMFHLAAEMRFHVKKSHWKHTGRPFDYKEVVSEEFYHLFEDRRLQKLGEDTFRVPHVFYEP